MRISVVIPTYNAADRLGRTIESVLEQSAPAHEVIVVDDGSTDATPAVCDSFGPRIRTLRVANGGQQRARNLGVAEAGGDWIALLDHDDLWDAGYLEATGTLAAGGGADLIFCNSRTLDERDGQTTVRVADRFHDGAPPGYWAAMGIVAPQKTSVLARYDLAAYLAYHPAVPTVTIMRREFYQALGGFNPALRGSGAENFEFELRALQRGRVGLVWQPLASVVRYGGNASADGGRMAMDLVACLEFVLATHDLDPASRAAVAAELQRRLAPAIEGAFLHRDYGSLRHYAGLAHRPVAGKAWVKCAVARMPRPLANLCATMLTRRGEAREGHPGR